MKKGKEWFINELLDHEIGDYGNSYNSGYDDGLAYALQLARQLNEPEKVVIPQFVADWISQAKKWGYSISDSMGHVGSYFGPTQYDKAVYWANKNQDIFARAWLDGYEVEKEQKYQVVIRDGEYIRLYLSKHGENVTIGTNGNYIEKCPEVTYLTEKEIKDYDERYWSFAVEVAE